MKKEIKANPNAIEIQAMKKALIKKGVVSHEEIEKEKPKKNA